MVQDQGTNRCGVCWGSLSCLWRDILVLLNSSARKDELALRALFCKIMNPDHGSFVLMV